MTPMPGKARQRRGRRIPLHIPVMIHWREPQGTWREVPAETRMLSQHGCLVVCPARIKLTDEVMVWWLEGGRYTQARVVFRSLSAGDLTEIALEFLGVEDFWQMDFSLPHKPATNDRPLAS